MLPHDLPVFVGRDAELKTVRAWLADTARATRVVFVTGMGGIGKSTFLRRAYHMARRDGARAVWIDGRAAGHTPAAFLEYLEGASELAGLERSARPNEPAPSVWCIDNYEHLRDMSGWLRETYFPGLFDKSVLIIVASRQEPPLTWRSDPIWLNRWTVLPLGSLTRAESRALLEQMGVATHPSADALLASAKGHPLALTLGSNALARQDEAGPKDAWGTTQEISAHILRETTSPQMLPFLDALTVLPAGDQEAISYVAGQPLLPDVFHELAALSFVQSGPLGLAIHDVARGILSSDLRWRSPSHFSTLRRRAAKFLHDRFTAAQGPLRRQLATLLMELCTDAMNIDFAVSAGLPYVDQMTPEDLPDLHRIVDRSVDHGIEIWPRAAYHTALDLVAGAMPESIRVARNTNGTPISYTVHLKLYRETMQLLDTLIPGLMAFLPGEERALLQRTPRERADTTLCITVGLETSTAPSPSGEGIDQLMRDAWASLSDRGRLLILLEGAEWRDVCESLGCTLYPLPGEPGRTGVFFADLDLRHIDFGAFALSVLDKLDSAGLGDDGTARSSLADGGESGRAQPAPGPPSVEEVRKALQCMHDLDALRYCGLTLRLGLDEHRLHAKLHELLTTVPPPAPLDDFAQSLLFASYIERGKNRADIASRFHLSRSSYFRHLAESLHKAALALANG